MRPLNLASLDAVGIVALALFTIAVLVAFKYLSHARQLRGFSDLDHELRLIRKLLSGKLTRRGKDLLIRGTYRRIPVLIRLARSENAPELTIRLRTPTRGNLFVAPVRAQVTTGELYVPVAHPLLGTRCIIRTDYIAETRSLLQFPRVIDELWNLCCSSGAFISIGDGVIHFTEAQLPPRSTASMVSRYLRSLAILAFAEKGKALPRIDRAPRAWHAGHLAAALVAVALLGAVFLTALAARNRSHEKEASITRGQRSGELRKIFGVGAWRLAYASDFDPRAVRWAEEKGDELAGTISGNFGSGGQQGTAYILVDPQTKAKRVIVVVGAAVRFDRIFPQLALATKLADVASAGTEWEQQAQVNSGGDGLLLVPDFNDPRSAFVVYNLGPQLAFATPRDFVSLHLH